MIDCFFTIGKTHDVCQDYARARFVGEGDRKDILVGISDGCSGSPDTDFGARLLTAAAFECYHRFGELKDEWIIWRALNCVPPHIASSCLDATLLMATWTDDGCVRTHCIGDGYFAFKLKDGRLLVHELDHAGAPGYLSYKLDQSRCTRYMKEFGNTFRWRLSADGKLVMDAEYAKFVPGPAQFFGNEQDACDVEAVAVFSDGVASFLDADFKPVPALDVIGKVMDIKSYTGEFVRRRCKFFLTKECPKLGWTHSDDFSMAAINTGKA